jgi:hypothetical protein
VIKPLKVRSEEKLIITYDSEGGLLVKGEGSQKVSVL